MSGLSCEGTDSKGGIMCRGGLIFKWISENPIEESRRSRGSHHLEKSGSCMVRGACPCFHRPTRAGSPLKKGEQKAQCNAAALVQERTASGVPQQIFCALAEASQNTPEMGILHTRSLLHREVSLLPVTSQMLSDVLLPLQGPALD